MNFFKVLKRRKISKHNLIFPSQWKAAKWNGTCFYKSAEIGELPCLGFIFKDQKLGGKIFKILKRRLGPIDKFEEIRISVIEGLEGYDNVTYVVHIYSDSYNTGKKLKANGYLLATETIKAQSISQSVLTPPDSSSLPGFRANFKESEQYAIAPFWNDPIADRDVKIGQDLVIKKSKIFFRRLEDIKEGDPDWVIIKSGVLNKKQDK